MPRALTFPLRIALAERELDYADMDAYDAARLTAYQLAREAPNAQHFYEAGMLEACRSRWVEALGMLDKAVDAHPNYVAALAERGLVYGCMERYDQGMLDLANAIELDPTYPRAYAYRATLHVLRGMWSHAVDDSTEAIKRAPTYGPAYKLRAIGYRGQNRSEKAAADFQSYLEYCPTAADREKIEESLKRMTNNGGGWLARLLGRK